MHPDSITFHKTIGWSIFFFSTLHTVAHMRNFALFAQATKTGFVGFLQANFATGPVSWMDVLVRVEPTYGIDIDRDGDAVPSCCVCRESRDGS